MCGIVGYVGARDCADVLVNALTNLEYRGYDSAGIAVFENGTIRTVKSKGRLADLQVKLNALGKPSGHVGIGHTRWATHGEPSDRNAHPHGDQVVTLVHNGIIENYKPLKAELLAKGVTFVSDTDTEVVARLMESLYHGDPVAALLETIKRLEGSFALGVMFGDFPDRIFAARRESPLIVGVGTHGDEHFIASDVTAILKYTRQYYLLEMDEVAELTADAVIFYDTARNVIHKDLKVADWDMNAAEKGGYEHFMLKEIYEQPTAVKTTITPRIQNGMPDLSECGITPEMLCGFSRIHVVACGTAMHAGMVGKYVIESLARIPVNVDIASEFRYRDPLVSARDLVIIISQSGETADSLAALRLAKSRGAKTLAIVNAKGSSIAREADMLIYTHAGPEIAVASTKAYMVQLAVMYLFAFELAFACGAIDEAECRRLTALLQAIPQQLTEVLGCAEDCRRIAAMLVPAESLLYIGRGLDYALSMEGSLKLKEISYIHSESYAAGELKHGTISLITENMPLIAVVTQHALVDKTVSNIKEAKARGALAIAVCADDVTIDPDAVNAVIKVPTFEDLLMPMTAVVPLQLLAYYTSVLRGNDVDKPRNLAKSVTVE